MSRRTSFAAGFILASALSSQVNAQSDDIARLPPERCSVREVGAFQKMEAISAAGALAEESMKVLAEIQTINDKATDPVRPVGEQLSPTDLTRFVELTSKLKVQQLASFIASRRERDLIAIDRMVQVADRIWRFDSLEPRGGDEDVYQAVIGALREAADQQEWSRELEEPKSTTCSMARALYRLQMEADVKLDADAFERDVQYLQDVAKEHGGLDDLSKLPKELRTPVVNARARVATTRSTLQFILDINNLRLMSEMSDLIYSTEQQDVVLGAGDIESVGKSINAMNERSLLDQRQKTAIQLWRFINEKIPSEYIKERAAIAEAVEPDAK